MIYNVREAAEYLGLPLNVCIPPGIEPGQAHQGGAIISRPSPGVPPADVPFFRGMADPPL